MILNLSVYFSDREYKSSIFTLEIWKTLNNQ